MRKIILVSLIASILIGCSTTTLKAPCAADGTHCKNRLKVNEWYNEE